MGPAERGVRSGYCDKLRCYKQNARGELEFSVFTRQTQRRAGASLAGRRRRLRAVAAESRPLAGWRDQLPAATSDPETWAQAL